MTAQEVAFRRYVAEKWPFPVAAFFQPVRFFDQLKAMGINTLFGPCVEDEKNLTPTQLAIARTTWAATAEFKGFSVVLKNPTPDLLSHAACGGFILSVDEPNEPKGGKPPVLAAAMNAEYQQLRALNPRMPIFMSLGGDKLLYDGFPNAADKQMYLDYAAICDVFTVDFYSKNRDASRYPVTHTALAVKNLAKLTGKPVWAWCECNDQQLPAPKPPDVNRAPTPDEMRDTVLTACNAGAAGIGFFFTCDTGKYGWPASFIPMVDRNGTTMQPQYDMIAELAGMLNPAPPPPGPTPQQQIDALRAVQDGHTQVIAEMMIKIASLENRLAAVAVAAAPPKTFNPQL